ncbi:uncharacterized protein KRP23_13908 [Phytophthora ramorum]|uniref:uncharacterized protein n=1 Tax=Phytophthora ramorum TaxID=164328 RepID=UPI0030AC3629|nr:hypothetical protein KRP23_13908 [Phytophthora ramorum]
MTTSGSSRDPGSPLSVLFETASPRTPKQPARTLKPKTVKIRTCTRRRREIDALTEEVACLKKQLGYVVHRKKRLKERGELTQLEATNKTMRDALHAHHLSLASTASLIAQFHRHRMLKPFDLPTRLGKDPFEREAELLRVKDDRLQLAYQFMLHRHHYQSAAEFCDKKKLEAASGDLVSIRFEAIPLPGARSIKAIFEAVHNFVYNIEINLTEAVGDVTIRENDDDKPGSPVTQHRLVTTVADLVQTDINSVVFAEYCPACLSGSGERELGLMVCDTVDEDELFPYQPQTRVQQDLTQITMLVWRQHDNGEPVIVLARWWCLRIRKNPNVDLPPFVVDRIRSRVDKMSEAMLLTAKFAEGNSVPSQSIM